MKFINSIAKQKLVIFDEKIEIKERCIDSKTVQRSALCRSRRELSNEYLLAKIGVDTAENEPLEVWGKIQFTIHFAPYSAALLPSIQVFSRCLVALLLGCFRTRGHRAAR